MSQEVVRVDSSTEKFGESKITFIGHRQFAIRSQVGGSSRCWVTLKPNDTVTGELTETERVSEGETVREVELKISSSTISNFNSRETFEIPEGSTISGLSPGYYEVFSRNGNPNSMSYPGSTANMILHMSYPKAGHKIETGIKRKLFTNNRYCGYGPDSTTAISLDFYTGNGRGTSRERGSSKRYLNIFPGYVGYFQSDQKTETAEITVEKKALIETFRYYGGLWLDTASGVLTSSGGDKSEFQSVSPTPWNVTDEDTSQVSFAIASPTSTHSGIRVSVDLNGRVSHFLLERGDCNLNAPSLLEVKVDSTYQMNEHGLTVLYSADLLSQFLDEDQMRLRQAAAGMRHLMDTKDLRDMDNEKFLLLKESLGIVVEIPSITNLAAFKNAIEEYRRASWVKGRNTLLEQEKQKIRLQK